MKMAKNDSKAPGTGISTDVEAEKQQQLMANSAFEEFAGAGFENQDAADYSIPFLHILQALSPILQERDDLKTGMIINTVTGEAFPQKTGLAFVPSTTKHEFVEFRPRDSGGGFVGAYDVNDPVVKAAKDASTDFGKYSTPEGNELIETFAVYGIAITDEGEVMQAVIGFTSSKIKKYKAWMTKAKTIQIQLADGRRIPAPLFSHRYRLKTVVEKNPKGTFSNWDIAFDGENALAARLMPSDPVFQAALATKELLDSGKAHANHEAAAGVSGNEESGAGVGGKPVF